MQANRPEVTVLSRTTKSAVSNGSRLLHGADARSAWARRFRDLFTEHVEDLGGPEATSCAERSIARRAATIVTELEQMESRFAEAGGATTEQLDAYTRAAGGLRRLLESVGIARRAKRINGDADRLTRLMDSD